VNSSDRGGSGSDRALDGTAPSKSISVGTGCSAAAAAAAAVRVVTCTASPVQLPPRG